MVNKQDINYINSQSGTKHMKSKLSDTEKKALKKLKEQFHRCDDNRKFIVQLDNKEKNWLNSQIIMIFTFFFVIGTLLNIIKTFVENKLFIFLILLDSILIISIFLLKIYFKYKQNTIILNKQMNGYDLALQKISNKWLEIEYEDIKKEN